MRIEMRKCGFVVVATLMFSAVLVATAAAASKVAVLDLSRGAGGGDEDGRVLTDEIRDAAVSTLGARGFSVMSRQEIVGRAPDGADVSKCGGVLACEVEMGRRIGAQFIITGEIAGAAGRFGAKLRAIDVGRGEQLAAEPAEGATRRDLEEAFRDAEAVLFDKILARAPAAEAAPETGTVPVTPAASGAFSVSAQDGNGNAIEAEVWVDGVEVGRSPGKFKVALGRRRVEIRAGDKLWSDWVEISEGETTRVMAVLAGATSAAQPPADQDSVSARVAALAAPPADGSGTVPTAKGPQPASSRQSMRAAAWACTGIAIAGIGTGIGFSAVLAYNYQLFKNTPSKKVANAAARDVPTDEAVLGAAFSIGGASLIAAIPLFVYSDRDIKAAFIYGPAAGRQHLALAIAW